MAIVKQNNLLIGTYFIIIKKTKNKIIIKDKIKDINNIKSNERKRKEKKEQ